LILTINNIIKPKTVKEEHFRNFSVFFSEIIEQKEATVPSLSIIKFGSDLKVA